MKGAFLAISLAVMTDKAPKYRAKGTPQGDTLVNPGKLDPLFRLKDQAVKGEIEIIQAAIYHSKPHFLCFYLPSALSQELYFL